ncbi:MAG: hypothetical protein H6817_07725 [Phycisphaerales bacterium]|nr:hypothetical protein [Phycisphaerales bacterium]
MAARLRQPGFMLLEIVIAVGLLVLGLAVIGGQLQTASDMTRETDHVARIVFLAESRLAELDSGLVVPNDQVADETGIEVEQDFGRLFPEYASRVTLTPTATADLIAVQLDIFYDPTRKVLEKGEQLDDFEYDDDMIVQTYHTLRVAPKPLNLRTDFGLDDEIADKIDEQLANSTLSGTLDVNNFDPSVFRDLDIDQLAELLGILQQAYGVDQSALMQIVPEEMRSQLNALLSGLDALSGGDGSDSGDGTDSGDDTNSGDGTTGDDGSGSDTGGNDDGASAGPGQSDDGGAPAGNGRGTGNPRQRGGRKGGRGGSGGGRGG